MAITKTHLNTTHKNDGSCAMTLSLTVTAHAENELQTRKALFKLLSEIMADLDAGRL